MQNDMLKNNIAPWQEKGRWYHGVADAVNHTFIADKTDDFILNNFTLVLLSSCYCLTANGNLGDDVASNSIIDVKLRFSGLGNSYGSGQSAISYFYKNGTYAWPIIPSGITSGVIEFWAFIVLNK